MKTRYVRLISEGREDTWNRQSDFSKLFDLSRTPASPRTQNGERFDLDPAGHLAFIKERHGEKIVAMQDDELVGWVGLFPDKDDGGLFYRLAGIEVHGEHRREGIGSGLLEEARHYLREKKAHRLTFGTNPLLTPCAALFVTRFGARFRWKEGVKAPDGRPWPYVSGECDFDDPQFKPLDLADDQVVGRSVLEWDGSCPRVRASLPHSGALSVVLPSFTSAEFSEAADSVPRFLETLHDVFHTLFVKGYGFAWFDRLSIKEARYYYVMKRLWAM